VTKPKLQTRIKGCLLSFFLTGGIMAAYLAFQLGIGYWVSSLLFVPLACIVGHFLGRILAE